MALQISNVPPSGKTTANSLANFVYNLLGYLPAPYIYGLVYDRTGGGSSIWGMFTLECAGVLAVVLMLLVLAKNKREESVVAAKESKALTQPLNLIMQVENLS